MTYHPFRNLGLKLLSVGLATLLWLAVLGQHVVERGVRVPLEFQNVPGALEIVGTPPTTADVRLRGTSRLLSRLQPGEVVAILDLASARPGARLFHLRTDQIRVPFGVEVVQVVPGTVAIDFERSSSRRVPVQPVVDGEPAEGFVVDRITVEPDTVEIVGPESRVRQVLSATTEAVSIDGAKASVKDLVTVGVTEASVRLREPQSAVVAVEIVPTPATREFPGVPLRLRNPPPGRHVRTEPAFVTVSLRGDPGALQTLTADAVTAYVDLTGLGPGRHTLPVRVEVKARAGLDAIRPAAAEATIR
jgi:YbbR domain-containing protein